jgi:hypothetical protein
MRPSQNQSNTGIPNAVCFPDIPGYTYIHPLGQVPVASVGKPAGQITVWVLVTMESSKLMVLCLVHIS